MGESVSVTLSPLSIITGLKLDYYLHCQIPFGAYAQVRLETDNTMKERTIGAIVMGPNQNLQGGVRFLNLNSGRILEQSRNDYTLLPMPEEVISRVEQMGRTNPEGLEFANRNGEPIDDNPEEQIFEESDDEESTDNEESSCEDSDSDDDGISIEEEGVNDTLSENTQGEEETEEEHETVFESEAEDDASQSEGEDTAGAAEMDDEGSDGQSVGTEGVDPNNDWTAEETNVLRSMYGREIRQIGTTITNTSLMVWSWPSMD